MFFDEHDPPHSHAEYQGSRAIFDFNGHVMKRSLDSLGSVDKSSRPVKPGVMM